MIEELEEKLETRNREYAELEAEAKEEVERLREESEEAVQALQQAERLGLALWPCAKARHAELLQCKQCEEELEQAMRAGRSERLMLSDPREQDRRDAHVHGARTRGHTMPIYTCKTIKSRALYRLS